MGRLVFFLSFVIPMKVTSQFAILNKYTNRASLKNDIERNVIRKGAPDRGAGRSLINSMIKLPKLVESLRGIVVPLCTFRNFLLLIHSCYTKSKLGNNFMVAMYVAGVGSFLLTDSLFHFRFLSLSRVEPTSKRHWSMLNIDACTRTVPRNKVITERNAMHLSSSIRCRVYYGAGDEAANRSIDRSIRWNSVIGGNNVSRVCPLVVLVLVANSQREKGSGEDHGKWGTTKEKVRTRLSFVIHHRVSLSAV